jgi:pilus assembly protein Flp/PilA
VQEQIQKFIDDEGGLTVVEYAVAGGLIAVAVVGAFIALGEAVGTNIEDLTDAVGGTAPGG